MFYIEDNNYVIVLYNEDRQLIEDTQQHLPQYSSLEIKETEEGYTIVDYELMTIEQAEEISNQKECERQRQLLLEQIDELDKKRIRAVCEPSIKDETTGETWLDYYNKQIQDLREQIKNLGG